jgi:ribonuclease HI
MKITVYTDGSSMHNGKPNCTGGWSSVFDMNGKLYVRYGHLEAPSSNNRGEIQGVLFAMLTLRERRDWEIEIISDSQYVVNTLTSWRSKRDRMGYEFTNADLFVPLFKAWDDHGNVGIEWVRGHTGNIGNERADEFAGCGMRGIDRNMVTDKVDIKMIHSDFFKGKL